MVKQYTTVPTKKEIKAHAIGMITSAADGNSPDENLYKAVLDRAVEDIGHEKYDSTQEWKDGVLDCFMELIGIEPSYAMLVLKKTGLVV